jgi:hypothetical protein
MQDIQGVVEIYVESLINTTRKNKQHLCLSFLRKTFHYKVFFSNFDI